ncbi:MAG: hypothetical protein ACK5U8_34020, partial [Deltaproteobacteria bacterium]
MREARLGRLSTGASRPRAARWGGLVAALACHAALASCVLGCGAKTGLEVPDAAIDAALDARSVDAGVPLDSAVPCIELSPDAGPVELPLDTQVEVGRADVVFLVDVTASMDQEIEQIKANLRDRLAPGLR